MNQQSNQDESIENLQLRIKELEKREKELLDKLQRNSSLHSMILDVLPMNIFLEDPNGRTIFANELACQSNGMKLEELVGKTVFDFFPKPIGQEQRDIDLKVWKERKLSTNVVTVKFQGKESYMLSGKTIIHLPDSNEEYLLGFGLDITDKKKAEDRVAHMAFHDALTGLPNRWFINSYLQNYQESLEKDHPMLGVLIFDLDHFKVINDSLGHHAGDLLLQSVALRIRKSIGEENIIARMGGDEFIVLIPAMQSPEEACEFCQLIIRIMEEPFSIYGQKFTITTSMGISLHSNHGEDMTSLIGNADIAMYHAKEKRRNSYTLYVPSMRENTMDKLDFLNKSIV